jgi:hypothetical protein
MIPFEQRRYTNEYGMDRDGFVFKCIWCNEVELARRENPNDLYEEGHIESVLCYDCQRTHRESVFQLNYSHLMRAKVTKIEPDDHYIYVGSLIITNDDGTSYRIAGDMYIEPIE